MVALREWLAPGGDHFAKAEALADTYRALPGNERRLALAEHDALKRFVRTFNCGTSEDPLPG